MVRDIVIFTVLMSNPENVHTWAGKIVMNMKSCGLEEALHHEYCLGILDMSKNTVFAAMDQGSTTFLIKH